MIKKIQIYLKKNKKKTEVISFSTDAATFNFFVDGKPGC